MALSISMSDVIVAQTTTLSTHVSARTDQVKTPRAGERVNKAIIRVTAALNATLTG
jgi:hypothetical protein